MEPIIVIHGSFTVCAKFPMYGTYVHLILKYQAILMTYDCVWTCTQLYNIHSL